MTQRIKQLAKMFRSDYAVKTFISSGVSLFLSIAFTLYNGFIGIFYGSVWNGAISIYYLLLALTRGITILAVCGKKSKEDRSLRRMSVLTHIIMLIIHEALIIPIAMLINGDRSYDFGMIPAIAMATYTTYRIVMSVIHYRKSCRSNNLFVKTLRTINLIDASVAVLTLQNTMIIANAGEINEDMRILCIASSTAIWLFIVMLTLISLFRVRKGRELNQP
ncbi:MAG: hypothetical protein ACI4JI_02055 [Ruminiclostridium sp.]